MGQRSVSVNQSKCTDLSSDENVFRDSLSDPFIINITCVALRKPPKYKYSGAYWNCNCFISDFNHRADTAAQFSCWSMWHQSSLSIFIIFFSLTVALIAISRLSIHTHIHIYVYIYMYTYLQGRLPVLQRLFPPCSFSASPHNNLNIKKQVM